MRYAPCSVAFVKANSRCCEARSGSANDARFSGVNGPRQPLEMLVIALIRRDDRNDRAAPVPAETHARFAPR